MPLFTPELEFSDDYPTIEPSLKLNFADARALDPRITFTRASVATYVGKDGLIKTAGENEARFDHDPITGESLGLLIEESRTNNITQSNVSNWSNSGVSKSTNTSQDVSPEGLNTATIVSESTNNGLHRIKSPNISFSDERTFSIWIKRNSGTRDLYLNANAIMGAGLNFDFDTETLGSTTGTASFERYPNQWYRFILTGTGTGNTNGVYLQFTESGDEGDDNYVGDASNSFLVWGAQLEAGAFVTSHIPTSGSTVTRGSDVMTLSGDNFSSWNNQSQGTYLMSIKNNSTSLSGLPSPARTQSIFLFLGNGGHFTKNLTSNVQVLQLSVNTTDFRKWAFYHDGANGYGMCIDGSTPVNSTQPIGTSDTSITFNDIQGQTSFYLKSLFYYPKRLSNAQLKTLTKNYL